MDLVGMLLSSEGWPVVPKRYAVDTAAGCYGGAAPSSWVLQV